ncbi:MAG: hypothetical protein JSS76_19965 [Bacteroidetes bacterium]|nr:hypothetical protein [Bacteroidota bacterium]
MITYEEALVIVLARIGWIDSWHYGVNTPFQCVVLEDHTIIRPYGWYFFYQTKAYVDDPIANASDVLAGNAPILVDKEGNMHSTGTAYPIEYYVEKYDKQFGVV